MDWLEKEQTKLEQQRIEIPLKYKEHGIDLYKRALDFNYQFVIFIGLIVGLGFTAIAQIQSKPIFFLGESILLVTAFLTLLYTRARIVFEASALFDAGNKQIKFFKDCQDLLSSAKTGSMDENGYGKAVGILAEPVFGHSSQDKAPLVTLPKSYIACLIVGATMLLVSFFWTSLYQIVLTISSKL